MRVYRVEHPLTEQGPYQSSRLPSLCECALSPHLYAADEHDDECVASELYDLAEQLNSAHLDNDHPLPQYDALDDDDEDDVNNVLRGGWVCGFATIDDLELWFGGWLGDLLGAGYEVLALDIDEARSIVLAHQVVFDPRNAAKVVLA